jgi:hypothetical protein
MGAGRTSALKASGREHPKYNVPNRGLRHLFNVNQNGIAWQLLDCGPENPDLQKTMLAEAAAYQAAYDACITSGLGSITIIGVSAGSSFASDLTAIGHTTFPPGLMILLHDTGTSLRATLASWQAFT